MAVCTYTGSGTLSFPLRGAFHLSLTVLVHYRSRPVFSLGGWSPRLPTGLHVPRGTQDSRPQAVSSGYRTLTVSGRAFQHVRLNPPCLLQVLQPRPGRIQHGLGCSRFARHYYGNLLLISSRRATEMFQFTHCPPACLCVQQAVSSDQAGGVAPFGYSGLNACMQLPLNVSPVSASFFGLPRLGIHLVRFSTCVGASSSRLDTLLCYLLSAAFCFGKIEVIVIISVMQL